MGIRVHAVARALIQILDEAQVQRTATILVALELGDGGIGGIRGVETDNTAAARPAAGSY